MTVTSLTRPGMGRWFGATRLVIRAACGLPMAALRRPGRQLIIHRATGEVSAR